MFYASRVHKDPSKLKDFKKASCTELTPCCFLFIHFVKRFKAFFSIVLISVLYETFPKEMQHKHLFTQDREPAPVLSNEYIKVQHSELMN